MAKLCLPLTVRSSISKSLFPVRNSEEEQSLAECVCYRSRSFEPSQRNAFEMSHFDAIGVRLNTMERKSSPSEVARLLAQIEAEYLAAKQGLSGFAETARHAAITARMETMGRLHKNLQEIVGVDAIKLIAERLENLPE